MGMIDGQEQPFETGTDHLPGLSASLSRSADSEIEMNRTLLLYRGLVTSRRRPDLEALARESCPERFVWRILPHAARSFAASIVVLPEEKARTAAVAYLYCRMLDTYEDLFPGTEQRAGKLFEFAERFEQRPMPAPAPIPESQIRNERERVYLLLVARCALVDEVCIKLPRPAQDAIAALVRSMAEGMAWANGAFARQGGVLVSEQQLARYCHSVIGEPALFVLRLVDAAELSPEVKRDALAVSEMIQLANVTRDIEHDLAMGIAYHPELEPFLGGVGDAAARDEAVRRVRERYLAYALRRMPAYRRLFESFERRSSRPARMAGILMLLFTEHHYRGCVARTGHAPWPGPRGPFQIVLRSLPALLSRRWARRTLQRVERDFLLAARQLPGETGLLSEPRGV